MVTDPCSFLFFSFVVYDYWFYALALSPKDCCFLMMDVNDIVLFCVLVFLKAEQF